MPLQRPQVANADRVDDEGDFPQGAQLNSAGSFRLAHFGWLISAGLSVRQYPLPDDDMR
jgi:hypothetical protein